MLNNEYNWKILYTLMLQVFAIIGLHYFSINLYISVE